MSLLIQEELEMESHKIWTLIRIAETALTSNVHISGIRTLIWVILDSLESLSRALSNLSNLISKFLTSTTQLPK